jgi:hypothetical protein
MLRRLTVRFHQRRLGDSAEQEFHSAGDVVAAAARAIENKTIGASRP